jgi:hypothetical protein
VVAKAISLSVEEAVKCCILISLLICLGMSYANGSGLQVGPAGKGAYGAGLAALGLRLASVIEDDD